MIGLKRFVRPGIVISAIGHAGALMAGLIFVGASSYQSILPEAMVVEIVPPDEAPRLEGTPADSRTSGFERSFNSMNANAVAQTPPPKPAAQQPQHQQQRPKPQRDARQASAQPQPAQSQVERAEIAQPETAELQASDPPPAPPKPHHEETQDQPVEAEMFARLALVGGRLGGGFAAPPVDTTKAAYDFTAPFREHVSSCSALPVGIGANDKIRVVLRVYLNRDGTLAATPQPLEPIATEKQQALVQGSMKALQKCQPYTMLPPEKYKQWKTLDLVFYPMNFFGQ
jgi:hypothetical protein